jgi:hypothetical protein
LKPEINPIALVAVPKTEYIYKAQAVYAFT